MAGGALRGAPDPPAAVAYRMLGSLSEADDAVQEAWLRLSRSDASGDREPGRVADDGRRPRVPGHAALAQVAPRGAARACTSPIRSSSREDGIDPEHEALLADSVGLALLVVLETLTPAERLAFVLHDMFAVPFDEIAPMVGRSPDGGAAAREPRPAPGAGRGPGAGHRPAPPARGRRRVLRRRARRRLRRARRGARPGRRAARRRRRRAPGASDVVHGARAVAAQALTFARLSPFVRPALVNGAAGVVVAPHGRPFSVMGFTVSGREDRRDRRDRRPRAPAPARPGGSRRLTSPRPGPGSR